MSEGPKIFTSRILDWSTLTKVLVLAMYITGYVVQVITFSIFLLLWDTTGAYVHHSGARELLEIGLISAIYCFCMIALLLLIIRYNITLHIEPFIYLIAAGFSVMLFISDTYIGPLNFSSGLISIGIPLLIFILFNRMPAYIILLMSCTGIIILSILITNGIIPFDNLRIYPEFTNPDHILFDVLSNLYFALPTLCILFFSFDHLLNSWRARQLDILHISRTDLLSGLLNRRAMTERLHAIYIECQTNQWPLTFVLLDLDHFKSINDNYGHLAGDVVIQYMGALLTKITRQADAVARYGGEEFLIVLKDTSRPQAALIAERCRLTLEGHQFTTDAGQHFSTSASFGIYSVEAPYSEKLQIVLLELDKQLYQAKHNGRNCIFIHGERYDNA